MPREGRDLARFLAKLNIPFCVVGNSDGAYLPPGCVGRIGVSFKEAVDDLAKRCLKRGVRTAEIVATNAGNQLFTRPVTVLQAENYATGDLVASIVSDHLCRHRDFPNISTKLRFVPGETL